MRNFSIFCYETCQRAFNRVRHFNQDQRGLETLQVILILAVAAIILSVIVKAWPEIERWAGDAVGNVVDFKVGGGK